jgi:hypothetical protein
MPLSMAQPYLKSDRVFRGRRGSGLRSQGESNGLILELVFRGNPGKWSWITSRINDLSLELVFRGSDQHSTHRPDKIRAFDAEFVLGKIPGKV